MANNNKYSVKLSDERTGSKKGEINYGLLRENETAKAKTNRNEIENSHYGKMLPKSPFSRPLSLSFPTFTISTKEQEFAYRMVNKIVNEMLCMLIG